MEDTVKFRQSLSELLKIAQAEENRIETKQIKACFSDFTLTDEQWELIYSYLELNKIVICDHNTDSRYGEFLKVTASPEEFFAEKSNLKEDGLLNEDSRESDGFFQREDESDAGHDTEPEEPISDLAGENSRFYQMYLEEIRGIESLDKQEEMQLVSRLLAGDGTVKERLIEGRLSYVVSLAGKHCQKGVPIADLVQEGNMALIAAVNTFTGGDYHTWLTAEIEAAFEDALAEQEGQKDAGNYLAAEANALMNVTAELAEELGREATLTELAGKMNLTEEAVREIMKISMDAMTMVETGGQGETFGKYES